MGESLIPSDLSLPAEAIDELFPFFIEVGADFTLQRLGRSLRKTCPDLKPGLLFTESFSPLRPEVPFELETLRSGHTTLYVFEECKTQLNMRGQIVALENGGFIFLGSPWLSETAELSARNLGMGDFAVHDPAVDLLHILRSQKMATDDLRRLTDKLRGQRTKLKEANTKLIEQEAETRQLALIAERTDNAVVLADPSGRIEWVNAGFTRLTGYELEETIGQIPGHLLQGPGTDPETVTFMRSQIAAQHPFRAEILNYHKSGQRYWVSFEVQPIFDDEGAIVHFMAIENETTAERATSANLRAQFLVSQILASDQTFETIASEIIETIRHEFDWEIARLWMKDAESNELRCAQIADDSSSSKSSSDSDERNSELAQLVWQNNEPEWWLATAGNDTSESDSSPWVSAVAVPIQLGEASMGVIELRSRESEPRDESRLQALTAIGSQLAQFIEGRRSQEKLQQRSEELARLNEELAAASRAKDEFLASISHEIRTPLNGVIGGTDELEQTQLDPEQKEAVDTIGASAGHLHSLLNDVLDHSRIGAGKLELLPEPTVLEQFINATARIFKPVATQKSLVFSVKTSVPSNLAVLIDGTRLRQILVNLLGNAFKFTSHGGVSLFVQHQVEAGNVHLDFTVTDSGIGIPEDRADQLFEPFEQLDSSRTRKFGGTGLGLAISRQLANLMNGSIVLERSSKNGSVFKVQLTAPVVDTPKSTSSDQSTFVSDRPILVVDDNPGNASVIKMLMRRLGLEVHHCFSAVDAMSYCAEFRPPLILMDLHMPDMDGIEATKILRSDILDKSKPLIPIVALTADARSEVRQNCLDAGMDEFITKPVRVIDLRKMLEHYLPKSKETSVAPVSAPAPAENEVLNLSITDAVFGEETSPEMQQEMNVMFNGMWQDIGPALEEIAAMQAAGQTTEGQKKCHGLRGLLANFGFKAAADLLAKMEYEDTEFADPNHLTRIREALTTGHTKLVARFQFLAPKQP